MIQLRTTPTTKTIATSGGCGKLLSRHDYVNNNVYGILLIRHPVKKLEYTVS